MGLRIVRHDDDKYSVFTTISDVMLLVDASREEFVEWYVTRQAEQARQDIEGDIESDGPGMRRFSSMTLLEILYAHIPENCETDKGGPEWNAFIAKRLAEEREKEGEPNDMEV